MGNGVTYHVNPDTGNVNVCQARLQCRFGDVQHHDSREAAQAAFEASMKKPKPVQKVKQINDFAATWEEQRFTFTGIHGSTIQLQVGRSDKMTTDRSKLLNYREVEAWLTNDEGETVAFMKCYTHEEGYYPDLGEHLSMCDVETRPDARRRGYARELRESVEAATNMLIYSGGTYTPEGWASFKNYSRHYPHALPPYNEPGVKANSTGFVASWRHHITLNRSRTMTWTKEQSEGYWNDIQGSEMLEKLENGDQRWAVE